MKVDVLTIYILVYTYKIHFKNNYFRFIQTKSTKIDRKSNNLLPSNYQYSIHSNKFLKYFFIIKKITVHCM